MKGKRHIFLVFGTILGSCVAVAIYVELNPRSLGKNSSAIEECLSLSKKYLIPQEGFPGPSSFQNKLEFSRQRSKCSYFASNQEWLKFEEGLAYKVKGQISGQGQCELTSILHQCAEPNK